MAKDKTGGDVFDFSGQQIEQGKGSQVNQGNVDNPTITNHNAEDLPKWKRPFAEFKEKVKDKEWLPDTPSTVTEKFATPLAATEAMESAIEAELDVKQKEQDGKPQEPDAPEVIETKKKTWAEVVDSLKPLAVKLSTNLGKALSDYAFSGTLPGVAAKSLFTTLGGMDSLA